MVINLVGFGHVSVIINNGLFNRSSIHLLTVEKSCVVSCSTLWSLDLLSKEQTNFLGVILLFEFQVLWNMRWFSFIAPE